MTNTPHFNAVIEATLETLNESKKTYSAKKANDKPGKKSKKAALKKQHAKK
jgi:hypothetical protein